MNKESLTRRAALGLLAGSGTLLVSDSLAITEIDASRGVNVDTAADSDALLGLTDASEGAEISGESETATVYEISDNVGSLSESNIDVTVLSLIRGDESETKITTPPVEATVRSTGGAQFAVDVSCASETTLSEDRTNWCWISGRQRTISRSLRPEQPVRLSQSVVRSTTGIRATTPMQATTAQHSRRIRVETSRPHLQSMKSAVIPRQQFLHQVTLI